MKTAFVTGATGLLGNNLVQALLARGVKVKGLCRDLEKGHKQLGAHPNLELVCGDMLEVEGFAHELEGCDVLFHTAAYFRDSFKGGKHWDKLHQVNVEGTRQLLDAAHQRGIRQIVHTSSIAVLDGPPGQAIDETMSRAMEDADDYFRSKIMAEQVVQAHLERHPDAHAVLVLPGWMHGPGDMGPTSAGQFVLDYMRGQLPGIPVASFAFVDARDVAQALISAAEKGQRGQRYLAAGHHILARDLALQLQQLTRKPAPKRDLSPKLLKLIAAANEVWASVSGQEVLLSMVAVKNMQREFDRSRFDHKKSQHELGFQARPIQETLRDEIAWFQAQGWLS